mmetsp:Transcript_7551/g.13960  ORF Transcript_7551/g.13960 Transcript_7551/m.13960 type:complete len:82 (-) Transcript_7551:2251-2496(-)
MQHTTKLPNAAFSITSLSATFELWGSGVVLLLYVITEQENSFVLLICWELLLPTSQSKQKWKDSKSPITRLKVFKRLGMDL